MFTNQSDIVISLAKDISYSMQDNMLDLKHLFEAFIRVPETKMLLRDVLDSAIKSDLDNVKELELEHFTGKMKLSEDIKSLLQTAQEFADMIADTLCPGYIDVKHLVVAFLNNQDAAKSFGFEPLSQKDAHKKLSEWYNEVGNDKYIFELTKQLKILKTKLQSSIFGQDHAVNLFIEGIFNAEVVASVDHKRKAPKAIFVFAGPPGVGKTFLAELGSTILDKPFKRFDMSAFSDNLQGNELIGNPKMFNGAKPGTLTGFVDQNPDAILLFDEIEKAHPNTIHLFLQLLDAGRLEDKFHEKVVNFRDTIVIFTTNAARQLYDNQAGAKSQNANPNYHRRTILNALETDIDQHTKQPFFPAAICSRLGKGYPILFNRLGTNDLVRIADAEIKRNMHLLEKRFLKSFVTDDKVAFSLVLREGGDADARTVSAQTQVFIRSEMLKLSQLFDTKNLESTFEQFDKISFRVNEKHINAAPDIKNIYQVTDEPKILLYTDRFISKLYKDKFPSIQFICDKIDDALNILSENDIDFIILDIWLSDEKNKKIDSLDGFDYIPLAAQALEPAQDFLSELKNRHLKTPVYLLSIESSEDEAILRPRITDELYFNYMQKWGVRGKLTSAFINSREENWEKHVEAFEKEIRFTYLKLYQDKVKSRLGNEQKVLVFDTSQKFIRDKKTVYIELRNMHLERSLYASDVGQLVDDTERPRVRFKDVMGAQAAKKELLFFIDYLKDSRKYLAMGITPPKGVLLHGPPGTGKTLLAKAMAGESDVAFISASASNFVTKWVGSGPENIKALFDRARKYAPSIIFIDEIDAIGKSRSGGGGGGTQAYDTTLNALLTEMDGFASPDADRPIFIMAATNFEIDPANSTGRLLDPALVRRFSRTILVDFPDIATRKEYLVNKCQGKLFKITSDIIDLLAERSTGMSIANLERIIEYATRKAVENKEKITNELLEEAFENIRYGEKKFWDENAKKRTAYHEAGHTIMYWLAGWFPSYVTIVSRGHFGGYMARSPEETEKKFGYTHTELINNVRVMLGGRMAEMVVFGNQDGLSTGASNDIQNATQVIKDIICVYGMDDDIGPVSISEDMNINVSEKISVLMKEQSQKTYELLSGHKDKLVMVAEKLITDERLDKKQLQEMLTK